MSAAVGTTFDSSSVSLGGCLSCSVGQFLAVWVSFLLRGSLSSLVGQFLVRWVIFVLGRLLTWTSRLSSALLFHWVSHFLQSFSGISSSNFTGIAVSHILGLFVFLDLFSSVYSVPWVFTVVIDWFFLWLAVDWLVGLNWTIGVVCIYDLSVIWKALETIVVSFEWRKVEPAPALNSTVKK